MSSSDLSARRGVAVAKGVATAFPIYADRALNAEIWDTEGRRYLDFAGGIAVLNTGHRHPVVMAAVQRQMEKFIHTAFQVMAYEPYVELCERLNALAPFSGPAKSILFSTGAEAVENAVKIARAATGRAGVIAFAGGFHGRTALTMALTGKVAPYKRNFGVSPPGIYHAPFPGYDGASVEDSLRTIETIFRTDIDPKDVATIIIEPIQGEGGFLAAPDAMLAALRNLCDLHGIMLIADEIQTGFARTGKMFAMEHSRVEPDLVTVAKSLGGGFPLSGVIGRAEVMDAAEPGGLGGTFAGNPVSCSAALAVLDIIVDERLLERAIHIGHVTKDALEMASSGDRGARVKNIRGVGAMVAFDLVDPVSGAPDANAAKRLTGAALEEGLILLSCGAHGSTIRLLNPLTISDAHLAEGLGKLASALAKLNA